MKNYKEYCKDCSYLIEKNKKWHCDMFDKPCKEIKEPNCFCEENKQALCIACSKEFKQDRDLQLCDDCITKYDTEKMWKDHDNNKIDILDVNENINLLNKYMK